MQPLQGGLYTPHPEDMLGRRLRVARADGTFCGIEGQAVALLPARDPVIVIRQDDGRLRQFYAWRYDILKGRD